METFTEEEIERIADLWSEGRTAHQIGYETEIPVARVRAALSDPLIQRQLADAKASKMRMFLLGAGLERLKTIIEEGSDTQAIQAVKTLREMLVVQPSTVKQLPQTLEASMKELDK